VIASEKTFPQPLDPPPCYSLMAHMRCAIVLCGLAVALAHPPAAWKLPGQHCMDSMAACMACAPQTPPNEEAMSCMQKGLDPPALSAFLEASGKCPKQDAWSPSSLPNFCANEGCKEALGAKMKLVIDECFQGGEHDFMACANDFGILSGCARPHGPAASMSLMGTDMVKVFGATIPKMGSDKDAAANPVIATVLAGLMGGVFGASLVALYLGRRSVGQPPLLG